MAFADVTWVATGGLESAILILMGVISYKLYKMSMRSKCHTKCCDMTFKMPQDVETNSPQTTA